jgi:hypothetical protein
MHCDRSQGVVSLLNYLLVVDVPAAASSAAAAGGAASLAASAAAASLAASVAAASLAAAALVKGVLGLVVSTGIEVEAALGGSTGLASVTLAFFFLPGFLALLFLFLLQDGKQTNYNFLQ